MLKCVALSLVFFLNTTENAKMLIITYLKSRKRSDIINAKEVGNLSL